MAIDTVFSYVLVLSSIKVCCFLTTSSWGSVLGAGGGGRRGATHSHPFDVLYRILTSQPQHLLFSGPRVKVRWYSPALQSFPHYCREEVENDDDDDNDNGDEREQAILSDVRSQILSQRVPKVSTVAHYCNVLIHTSPCPQITENFGYNPFSKGGYNKSVSTTACMPVARLSALKSLDFPLTIIIYVNCNILKRKNWRYENKIVGEREEVRKWRREREEVRKGQRDTERERGGGSDRQIDRERDRERQTDRERDRERDGSFATPLLLLRN